MPLGLTALLEHFFYNVGQHFSNIFQQWDLLDVKPVKTHYQSFKSWLCHSKLTNEIVLQSSRIQLLLKLECFHFYWPFSQKIYNTSNIYLNYFYSTFSSHAFALSQINTAHPLKNANSDRVVSQKDRSNNYTTAVV